MSKRQLLILLGIWIMAFLFLGFPSAWDKLFALVAGALIVTIAFALKPKEKSALKGTVPFVEHKASASDETPITNADSPMSS